jgi:glycosyltransferase involved in cell wall biosynthesis
VPTVVTLLDLVWRDYPDTMRFMNRWAATFGERSLLTADHILCISAFTRSRLLHHWPHLESRSSVVPLAPNSRLASVVAEGKTRPPQPGTRPWVITVDTIEPRKDLDTLVAAMASCPDVDLVHCGAVGWKVDRVVARASAAHNCRLLGYVDEGTLAGLYDGAVCAVFASLYEGFHLAPLDAASLGCPVVLSDIPVHREVFGDAALYFRVGDADGLADLIRMVATDARLREEYGRHGRERAGLFSWDATARGVASALRLVVR